MPQAGDGDDDRGLVGVRRRGLAVRRDVDALALVVAGGRDDDHALVAQRGQRVDVGGAILIRGAIARTAQAHVDHPGRIRIGRHVRDRNAAGPHGGGDDVGIVAAALAQRARHHDLGVVADARHAGAVVGRGAQDAGRLRAVPAAVDDVQVRPGRVVGEVTVVALVERAVLVRVLRAGDVVARVGRVGVREAAVVGRRQRVAGAGQADTVEVVGGAPADEVVPGQHLAVEVGVLGDAGVDVADDDGRGAVRDGPGRLDVDAGQDVVALRIEARRAQVPLAGHRTAGRGGRGQGVGIQRIVHRRRLDEASMVDLHPLDVAVRAQGRGQRRRRHAVGHHHLAAFPQRATVAQRQAEARTHRARLLRARGRCGGRRRGGRRQDRRARLELHDDPAVAAGFGQRAGRPAHRVAFDRDGHRAHRGRDRDTQTDRTQQPTQPCHRTLRKLERPATQGLVMDTSLVEPRLQRRCAFASNRTIDTFIRNRM